MARSAMADVFGEGSDAPPEAQEPDEEESEYPPEYMEAYEEWELAPSAKTFWRAVEACTSAGEGGGLAILLGDKGKKK